MSSRPIAEAKHLVEWYPPNRHDLSGFGVSLIQRTGARWSQTVDVPPRSADEHRRTALLGQASDAVSEEGVEAVGVDVVDDEAVWFPIT